MYDFTFYETEYWRYRGRMDSQCDELSLAPTLEIMGVGEAVIAAYRDEYAEWVTTDKCKEAADW